MKEKIKICFWQTASHNVDPQNGFTPLCPNELPVPDGDNIVVELNKQNSLAKYKTVSKDMHPTNAIWIANENQPQFSVIGKPDVDIAWESHCMSGTFGSELISGLPKISEYDFFVAKGFEPDMHPYSSCYHDLNKRISTGLIEWYDYNNVKTVIVGGLALNVEETPLCVGTTIIDLCDAGFKVILNMGATRGLGTDDGRKKFIDMLIENYHIQVVDSADDIEIV